MPLLPNAEPLLAAGSRSAVLALNGFTGQPHSMSPSAPCPLRRQEQRHASARAARTALLDNDAEAISAGSLESIRGRGARTAVQPGPVGLPSDPAASRILRQHQ